MSDPQRLQDLAELLLEATTKGTVRWHRTPDPDTFRLSLPPGYVRISQDRRVGLDEVRGRLPAEISYNVVLLNKDGMEVENWTSPVDNGEDSLPARLFMAARRSALEVDETYEGMLHRLKLMLETSKERGARREPAHEGS